GGGRDWLGSAGRIGSGGSRWLPRNWWRSCPPRRCASHCRHKGWSRSWILARATRCRRTRHWRSDFPRNRRRSRTDGRPPRNYCYAHRRHSPSPSSPLPPHPTPPPHPPPPAPEPAAPAPAKTAAASEGGGGPERQRGGQEPRGGEDRHLLHGVLLTCPWTGYRPRAAQPVTAARPPAAAPDPDERTGYASPWRPAPT